MGSGIQGHLSDGVLEEYSLDKLRESCLVALEEHLLICDQCRARLEAIEPVNYIHYSQDGPIYSRVTRLATGRLLARHWGKDVDGGKVFGSIVAAKTYLSESFSLMFPEHGCNRWCSQPSAGSTPTPVKKKALRYFSTGGY